MSKEWQPIKGYHRAYVISRDREVWEQHNGHETALKVHPMENGNRFVMLRLNEMNQPDRTVCVEELARAVFQGD